MSRRWSLAFALSSVLAAAPLRAEEGRPPEDEAASDEDRSAPARDEDDAGDGLRLEEGAPPAREGSYKGVSPGSSNLPPRPPRLPLAKGPQRMTWPGFQVRDGVPTVFLQLTKVPSYEVDARPGQVVVTLKRTVVPLKNNLRPLKVGPFGTSVQEVDVKRRGRDVQILIRTKGGGAPAHRERVETQDSGFHLLVIELPQAG